MTPDTGGSAIGAGWFPDPAGSAWFRWWDGAVWTEHFIDPATGAPPRVTGQAVVSEAPLTRRELRDQQSDLNADARATTAPIAVVRNVEQAPPLEPTAAPASRFGDLLQGQQPQQPPPTAPFAPTLDGPAFGQSWNTVPPPRLEDAYFPAREQPYVPIMDPPTTTAEVAPAAVSTVPIWLYAILPVLHVAAAWFVVEKLKISDLGGLRWAIIAGPIVIYLILALVDRRVLQARGHEHLVSILLAILPPFYIGLRAARMGARAVAPAIVWFVLQAAGIAVLVSLFPGVITQLTAADVASPAITRPIPTASTHVLTAAERAKLLTPEGMAAELKSEFVSRGVALTSVTCPPLANTTQGTQVTCLGVLSGGKLDIVVAVDNVTTLAAFDVISSQPHQGD